VLTPAGHHFLLHAREIVTKYEQGINDFELWKQGYKRRLTIATAPQIASSVLPSILRSFMDENPDIEVLINILNSYEIGEEIKVGRADLGLTRIKPVQTKVNCHIIHEEPVILVSPYMDGEECKYNEETLLQKYTLITHNHPDYWDNLLNDIKRDYPTIRTMKVNQIEITKRFIEQRLGVSYLPYTMVREEINMNKLVEIKPNKISLPTSSTYVLTKVETDEVTKFIGFLKGQVAKF
jgi:LysR family transcriptional regulator, repressor for citA